MWALLGAGLLAPTACDGGGGMMEPPPSVFVARLVFHGVVTHRGRGVGNVEVVISARNRCEHPSLSEQRTAQTDDEGRYREELVLAGISLRCFTLEFVPPSGSGLASTIVSDLLVEPLRHRETRFVNVGAALGERQPSE